MLTPPRSFASSASRSSTAFSASRERRIFIAVSLFAVWLRSFCTETTMPLGMCVSRTAESVLFTCCPPAPDERNVSTRTSSSSISMPATSSSSGATITCPKLVWRRCAESNGLWRTRRCLPRSALRIPYALSPLSVNVADLIPYSSPGSCRASRS